MYNEFDESVKFTNMVHCRWSTQRRNNNIV